MMMMVVVGIVMVIAIISSTLPFVSGQMDQLAKQIEGMASLDRRLMAYIRWAIELTLEHIAILSQRFRARYSA